jgi:hypothetical protein
MKHFSKNHKQAVFIKTRLEEMDICDVRKKLGRIKFESITKNDDTPMFVTLVAGHEGVSSGRLVGKNVPVRSAKKRWSRKRISELAEKLASSVPLFNGHPNGEIIREPVGIIVRSFERWEDNKMGAAGTAYIKDHETRQRIRSGEINTCSIEAEIECHKRKGEDTWVVDMIRKVTGVALGNSSTLTPGFPGAMVLATVEEFEEYSETEDFEKTLEDKEKQIETLKSEIAAIKDEGVIQSRKSEARQTARSILDERNISPGEKKIILNEVSNLLTKDPGDMERTVKEVVDKELIKIDELRAVWKKEQINTPPEKGSGSSDTENPLIPRTPGW